MRSVLLLSAALAALLMSPAGAQVAANQSQGLPAPGGIAGGVKAEASQDSNRAVARPVAPRKPTAATPAVVPPLPLPPMMKGLVIDSMDLRQIERSVGGFSIAIIPIPPALIVPAPSTAPELAVAPTTPVQAETLAPASPIPQKDALRIEAVAGAEPAILLRTDPDVGLAAFRVGSDTIIVLDAAIVFQAAGQDLNPVFAGLTSRRTQDATVIRIPMAPADLRFRHAARGWQVTAGPAVDRGVSILPRLIQGGSDASRVRLVVTEPSRVVTVLNPQTGGRLLVGTVGAAGQAVASAWPQPQFSLLPTLQGVVVAPISDDIRLRREPDGFTLATSQQADGVTEGTWQKAPNAPVAAPVSRLFDIPNGTTKELADTLNERIRIAGQAHALARSGPRLRVAEAMLALGMDVEAQSVIDVAAAADPALMDQPHAIGLRAVAAALAGRIEDAKPLGDSRLTGSTEIEFWRAFLQVTRDDASARDALCLSEALPLLLRYPDALRGRLLPGTLEAMVLNGQAEAAGIVLKTLPDDRNLDLARGMAFELDNKPAEALKAYDQVAARGDRLPRYKALVRATELRIKDGEFDARAGADALDRALLGWRGAKQELGLRLRIAELRGQADQWRAALTVLRDGREIFPEERAQLDQKMPSIFIALLNDDAARHLSPADFVTLYDQNLDLVREISWSEKSGTDLVERLVGLNLQGRAEPIMGQLVARSTDPVRRTVLGARLASLRITMDDPAGAIAALASTVPLANAAADPATMQVRQLLYARAEAQRGNRDAALAMLGGIDAADADEVRSEIYAARKDWVGVVAALTALEHKQILTDNLTEPQQAIVMRLAVAATLSADPATLARVAESYGTVMAKSTSASLFRLMTSAPARGTGDLPRAFEEIQLAKQLEGRIGMAVRP
jgi:hypothetical protein